jgi:hypothetical protein
MASSYSPLLRAELIGTGDQSGTWGITTNTNLGTILEDAIAGTAAIDVTSANVTLTNVDGAADQARCMILRIFGTPGVSRNVVAPSHSKIYVVINNSDAAVVLKGSATTGLTIAAGARIIAGWSGTDFIEVANTSSANGDVLGPASATDNAIVLFNGTTGKSIKNSSATLPSGALVGTTDSQTLTNKTINGANNTFVDINLASQVAGTLPVANGGTGATTLTGVVIGTGTTAFTTKTNPIGAFVGTSDSQTLTNKLLTSPRESFVTTAAGAGSFLTFDIATSAGVYYTQNATANSSVNFRWDGATTLDSVLGVNQSITFAFLSTQGSTGYVVSSVSIDAISQTVRWVNGAAPTTGNPTSIDSYVFTIIKTSASPTYTVLGSRTRYA